MQFFVLPTKGIFHGTYDAPDHVRREAEGISIPGGGPPSKGFAALGDAAAHCVRSGFPPFVRAPRR